jgi:hypothetical protein
VAALLSALALTSIERELGHGGMATVYLAEDLSDAMLGGGSSSMGASLSKRRTSRQADSISSLEGHVGPNFSGGEFCFFG